MNPMTVLAKVPPKQRRLVYLVAAAALLTLFVYSVIQALRDGQDITTAVVSGFGAVQALLAHYHVQVPDLDDLDQL